MAADQDFIFRQLLEYTTYTYTFILADGKTKEAVIIDPVLEMVERDVQLVKEMGLNLLYGINTHVHADHVTGTGMIKKHIPTCKSAIAAAGKAKADVQLKDKDVIKFGQFKLECRSTPGHTDGCMSFVLHEKGIAFTGDALLIRGCGRTDFQQGDSKKLFNSVHQQLLSLPDHFLLYPAHDYKGRMVTSVSEEKKHNARLTKSVDEFVKIMSDLKLDYPKFIDKALPANVVDGLLEDKK